MAKPIVPITRLNKWFSEEDFDLEIQFGIESLYDNNVTVILYKVDRDKTQYDDLYGEAVTGGIKFLPPYELKVAPIMGEPENKTYDKNGTNRFLQDGKFVFELYSEQLLELDVEIVYGDYIGYSVLESEIRYFTVVNDGIKNFDDKHTIMGYRGAFRTIECAPVDKLEFDGI